MCALNVSLSIWSSQCVLSMCLSQAKAIAETAEAGRVAAEADAASEKAKAEKATAEAKAIVERIEVAEAKAVSEAVALQSSHVFL